MEDNLRYLAGLYDVEVEYLDAAGVLQQVSDTTVKAVLAAMGVETNSWQETEDRIRECLTARAARGIAPTLTYDEGQEQLLIQLTVKADDPFQKLSWIIKEENKTTKHEGEIARSDMREVSQSELWGEKWFCYEICINVKLPLGYHDLTISGLNSKSCKACLIIAPTKCYLGKSLDNGDRYWGIQTELYSLKRYNDWGIGDFTSLRELAKIAVELGADFISCAPLHDLDVRETRGQNPYYPTNRFALNPLFIDIEMVPELKDTPKLKNLIESDVHKQRIEKLRNAEAIDYRTVLHMKQNALKTLYSTFVEQHLNKKTERARQYQAFIKTHPMIVKYAVFEALKEYFEQLQVSGNGWRYWPKEYQRYDTPEVKEFSEKYADNIEYYQYVQWIADDQFSRAIQMSKEIGLEFGFFNAVAANPRSSSSESWTFQDVFAANTHLGTPPEPRVPEGRNTRICCWNPHALQETHFEAFIRLLRSTMRYARGVRLGRFGFMPRLYWIPDKCRANQGTYVRYPIRDIKAIIALESVRNHCMVIADDLTSAEIDSSEEFHILQRQAYLYTGGNAYKQSWHYHHHSVASVGDHNLPTIKNYWLGTDILAREDAGLLNVLEASRAQTKRAEKKEALLKTLENEDLIKLDGTPKLHEVIIGLHRLLARSPALLFFASLADLVEGERYLNSKELMETLPSWASYIPVYLEDLLRTKSVLLNTEAIKKEGRS